MYVIGKGGNIDSWGDFSQYPFSLQSYVYVFLSGFIKRGNFSFTLSDTCIGATRNVSFDFGGIPSGSENPVKRLFLRSCRFYSYANGISYPDLSFSYLPYCQYHFHYMFKLHTLVPSQTIPSTFSSAYSCLGFSLLFIRPSSYVYTNSSICFHSIRILIISIYSLSFYRPYPLLVNSLSHIHS